MRNISRLERSVRLWFGLAMIVGCIQAGSLLPWSAIGLMLVLTVIAGFCPMYAMAGFRTQICCLRS
ncbi:DUF2892 domain-containing protein [Mariprofundus erugo]|uniref:DUF2892 domain-containing protein n=1 Tax=Mariprofundus erugo TaxID=2528639 RepID=A0A5R9GNV4_9PROT|nr:DUF2892 domain-containing protein [Mariprofundus erugo]TLS66123.1 DUF2892 domain-containing protein [Mariprofundus erugo]TLS75619.1 DUF2892 domain-containing protein [Mariprofundus erugo]